MVEESTVEARLERLEAQAAVPPATSGASVERALKYLPYMAIAHVLIGAPTLLLSLVLAYATFVQADATQKMQQGGALPFISYGTSNADVQTGAPEITLDLANNGVGPALLGPLEIRYEGQAVRNARDLLVRCCGLVPGAGQSYAIAPGSGTGQRVGRARTTRPADRRARRVRPGSIANGYNGRRRRGGICTRPDGAPATVPTAERTPATGGRAVPGVGSGEVRRHRAGALDASHQSGRCGPVIPVTSWRTRHVARSSSSSQIVPPQVGQGLIGNRHHRHRTRVRPSAFARPSNRSIAALMTATRAAPSAA